MNPRLFSVLLLPLLPLISLLPFTQAQALDTGYTDDGLADHATTNDNSDNYVRDSENFASTYFKTEGHFDPVKIQNFIERLKKEKQSLAEDLRETKLIEKVELDVVDIKTAKEAALKQLDESKNALLIGYNSYLIPRITALLEKVRNGAPPEETEGLVDEFIALYAGYYLPKSPRNPWNKDIDPIVVVKNSLGYRFERKNSKYIEANNLIVEKENHDEINRCLPAAPSQYLTSLQLTQLQQCGFDLSRLNPGKSALWMDLSKGDRANEARDQHIDWFPRDDEKIHFDSIKYSGFGSPKLAVFFKRDGESHELKIKMGKETHQEIATSILGRLLGLHQDTMAFRPYIKVHLGKTTYEAFQAMWLRKYHGLNKELASFLFSHGKENGEDWVILRDVALESKDPGKIRLEGYNPVGWDLPNRREHRGLVLWYAWLNILDTKAGNHVINLVQTPQGFVPEYSLQDVGYSLHQSINLKHLTETLRSISSWSVNSFSTHMLDYDEQSVNIEWTEVMLDKERFQTSTYSDVKWMARQISRLSAEDIRYAFEASGFPPPVADLYTKKVTFRRNSIVKAFGLENEYGIYPVPDLEHYSPNEAVKNGKIVVTHFPGYSAYEPTRTNILLNILQLIDGSFTTRLLESEFLTQVGKTIGLETSKEITLEKASAGIKLGMSRRVEVNTQIVNYDNASQAFVVRDRFMVSLDITSGIIEQIRDLIPVTIGADLKVWQKEFEFVHFASSWKEAYTSPFAMLRFIRDFKKAVAFELNPNEVLKISDGYGFRVTARVSDSAALPTDTSVQASLYWRSSTPIYFARDSFGQLLIYKERNHVLSGGLHVNLAEIDLLVSALPIVGIDYTCDKFFQHAELFTFGMPAYDLGLSALDQLQRKRDYEAFRAFLDGNEDIETMIHKDLNLDARGTLHSITSTFLFLWKREELEGYSKATVAPIDGPVRQFHRYYLSQASLFGLPDGIPFIKRKDTRVPQKDSYSVAIEVDDENPENLVILAQIGDYDRKKTRQQLLSYIEILNQRYSYSQDQPFFRNYVLPSEQEVKIYRKLYTHIRVFLGGKNLFEKLAALHWRKVRITDQTEKMQEYRKRFRQNPGKFLKAVAEYIKRLKLPRRGLGALKPLVNLENIFVMGEIYGIYPSFSTLQQAESTAGRRFGGKSWGGFEAIPPIWTFLKEHRLTPISPYIETFSTDTIFGTLPSPDCNIKPF